MRTARCPGFIAQPPLHDPGGAPGPRAAQPNSGLEQGPLKSALARRATKHSLHTTTHSLHSLAPEYKTLCLKHKAAFNTRLCSKHKVVFRSPPKSQTLCFETLRCIRRSSRSLGRCWRAGSSESTLINVIIVSSRGGGGSRWSSGLVFDERELCRRRLLMPLIRHAGED